MLTLALDPKLALPPGLAHEAVEREAIRFTTLEVIDLRRNGH